MSGNRYVEIARDPARLRLRVGCLIVEREDSPEVSVPVGEISAVVLAHPRCSITQPVLNALMEAGVPVLVCDGEMLPSGMMLPLRANALQTQRMLSQAATKAPVRKRLWQQIIRTKIRAQAATLDGLHQDDGGLGAMVTLVRSGDPTNIEARAAGRYWPLLFNDPEFRRRFDAEDQNRLLNYGYAVLRATMSRAICAAGLHPTIGLHHRARGNAFCLADDLMEPYRPLVDAEVARLTGERGRDCPLDSQTKAQLVAISDMRLRIIKNSSEMRAASECIGRTAVSLAQCLSARGSASGFDSIFFPYGLQEW